MIAILSTIFGVLGGIIPNIVKILEMRTSYKYELELTKIKLEAAARGLDMQFATEAVKAEANESVSVRQHDTSIVYNDTLNTLRASIRPLLTYFFFFMFCGIKIAAASLMFQNGYNGIEVLNAVWDIHTVAIFGAVMGFWFGSRSMYYLNDKYNINTRTFIPNKK
jgi:hypothetical protein